MCGVNDRQMQCTKEDQLFDISCFRCTVVQMSTEHLNLHTGQKLLALSLTISNVFGLLSVDKYIQHLIKG